MPVHPVHAQIMEFVLIYLKDTREIHINACARMVSVGSLVELLMAWSGEESRWPRFWCEKQHRLVCLEFRIMSDSYVLNVRRMGYVAGKSTGIVVEQKEGELPWMTSLIEKTNKPNGFVSPFRFSIKTHPGWCLTGRANGFVRCTVVR